jgi:hypothetical protein
MNSNRLIIGAGLIIALTGAMIAVQEDRSVMPIVGGALGFTLLLGLLAAVGEGPSKVAGGLAMVGATSVIFYEAIPLFGLFTDIGKGGLGNGGPHGPWVDPNPPPEPQHR